MRVSRQWPTLTSSLSSLSSLRRRWSRIGSSEIRYRWLVALLIAFRRNVIRLGLKWNISSRVWRKLMNWKISFSFWPSLWRRRYPKIILTWWSTFIWPLDICFRLFFRWSCNLKVQPLISNLKKFHSLKVLYLSWNRSSGQLCKQRSRKLPKTSDAWTMWWTMAPSQSSSW